MRKASHLAPGRTIALVSTLLLVTQTTMAEEQTSTWIPWISSGAIAAEINRPPATTAELVTLKERVSNLDASATQNVYHWPSNNPNYRWVQMALERYASGPPSPKKGRGLALLNIAIYDAIAIATSSQQSFKRVKPDLDSALIHNPSRFSYPSTHAAAASAAAGVLTYLFPDEAGIFDQQALLAASARVDGGANYPSDVDAGLNLGKGVAAEIIEFAKTDGSDAKFSGDRPMGPDKLKGDLFVYPTAGDWKPFGIQSTSAYVPPPPPNIDSEDLRGQLDELNEIERNVPNSIRAWVNHSTWRAYHWWYEKLATAVFERGRSIDLTNVALAYASVSAANHDSILACFKSKYTYWFIRPAQLDPSVPALFPNPPHPSYPAAHSCSSMSYAVAITHFFPEHEASLQAAANEAGYSRLIGGIHYPMDKEAGEKIGRGVTEEVLGRASSLKVR